MAIKQTVFVNVWSTGDLIKETLDHIEYFDDHRVTVLHQPDERDLPFSAMPLIAIFLESAELELTNIPDGYHMTLPFQIEIAAYDLSEIRKAAKIRDELFGMVLQRLGEDNPLRSGTNSVTLGPDISFETGAVQGGASGHVATVSFTLLIELDMATQ